MCLISRSSCAPLDIHICDKRGRDLTKRYEDPIHNKKEQDENKPITSKTTSTTKLTSTTTLTIIMSPEETEAIEEFKRKRPRKEEIEKEEKTKNYKERINSG